MNAIKGKIIKGLNNYLINVSNIADHTIFISDWLKKLFINSGFEDRKNSVIRNGANNEFFQLLTTKTISKQNKDSNTSLDFI